MSVDDVKNTLNRAAQSAERDERRDKIVADAATLSEEDFETRIDEYLEALEKVGVSWSITFLKGAVRRQRSKNKREEKARQREAEQAAKETKSDPASKYQIRDAGLIFRVGDEVEGYDLQLTNFVAKISADITRDGGQETTHWFEIQGAVSEQGGAKQQLRSTTVRAVDYANLRWIPDLLGAGATIYVNKQATDHVRVAIQSISTDRVERTEYTHFGWRLIDNVWAYLHAGGALGAQGTLHNVWVTPPIDNCII